MDQLLQRLAAHRGPSAYWTVFALIAGAGLGIPINEDVVILGAGALTLYQVFEPRLLVATILLGLLVADSLIYFWGRKLGAALLLKRPFSFVVSPSKLEAAQGRFKGGGAGLIFATRFLAGLRAPIHFAAGTLKISYRTFALCDIGAALFEVPALIYAARYVGGHVDVVLPYLKRGELVLVAAFLVWLALRVKRYWLPPGGLSMPALGVKEALILAAIGVHFPRYWTRLGDVATSSGALGVAAYIGIFAALTAAILVASHARSAAARWFWAVVLTASMVFFEAQRLIMREPLEYGMFVGLLNATDSTFDAVSQFAGPIALAALNGLLLFAGIVVKPKPSKVSAHPASPAAPALATLALAVLSFLRNGGGVRGLPSSFIPLAYGSLFAYEDLTEGRQPRKPVELALVSPPRYRHVVLLVDESIRGDYLDINWPGGVRSGLEKGPGIVNFGLAASITNCSAGTNIALRFGGTRDNYRTTRATMPSIWQYAKKAGYKTVYIDGQRVGGRLSNGMFKSEVRDIDRVIQFDDVPVLQRDMEAARLVAELSKSSEPLFIMVNKVGAHYPVNDKFPDAFAKYRPMLPRDGAATVTDADARRREASDWGLYKNSYKNAVLWSVGEFFDRLRKGVDLEKTLVLYTSDHGQNFHERGNPGLNTHCSTDPSIEEGLVPLVVLTSRADEGRWREAARGGFNASSHYRLFPTLLDAMGYDAAAVEKIYGPSLTEKIDDPFTFNARFEARFRAEPVWVKIDLKQVRGPDRS